MLENANALTWWVAPLYKELIPATKKVRDLTPIGMVDKKLETSEVIRYLRLRNGSECFFHSADKEDSLRGSGLHRLTVDEAPLLKTNRWEAELKPSLIDYNAPCMFIGTPKPKNWFSAIYQKGQDPAQNEYRSFRFSSYGNAIENGGFIPKANIDAIANDMSELLRRQEINAEELEGEGIVFRHINRQIKNENEVPPYREGETVVTASDLGKTIDYTVNIAMRLNGEIIGFERYNQLDWHFQRKKTIAFAQRFGNAALLIDATGLGDPIYDEMQNEYSNVEGYKFTNATKKALIENLSIMLDNGEIWFPGNPETHEFSTQLNEQFPVLKSELESFTYELLPSGLIRYGAPEGLHDDACLTLALCAWQLRNVGGNVEIGFANRNRR